MYLSTQETARELGCTAATVRTWARKGTIPVDRYDGLHMRFELDKVRDALSIRRQPSVISMPRAMWIGFLCTYLESAPDQANAVGVIAGLRNGSLPVESVLADLGYTL